MLFPLCRQTLHSSGAASILSDGCLEFHSDIQLWTLLKEYYLLYNIEHMFVELFEIVLDISSESGGIVYISPAQ
jgi:hypothetical protein